MVDAPLVDRPRSTTSHLVTSTCEEYGVTQVVHFAAYKSVGESMESPAKLLAEQRRRHGGTHRGRSLGRRQRRRVLVVVLRVRNAGDGPRSDETAAIQPESVYAETKAMVERILRWYGETKGLRAVSLRYFNAAGASFDGRIGEDWTYSINLIPLAMKAVLLGDRKLQVFGDRLRHTRRFLHP